MGHGSSEGEGSIGATSWEASLDCVDERSGLGGSIATGPPSFGSLSFPSFSGGVDGLDRTGGKLGRMGERYTRVTT